MRAQYKTDVTQASQWTKGGRMW